ncbi:FAD-linked oxidoreductase-like protein [Radiomyces spectabilis]|uniref:FAD-linked oxidoreductase-like protein n=1 Tax=Radiomyces spectabilis TaxID=64574 RepID=UPI002220A134|nr:FAD-linked oxidoreductase-like protein [Radiomyces spectabilis]KAI8373228.1 FAD-linked oxidoreductase-like protein [Radiomyces spectabilis]
MYRSLSFAAVHTVRPLYRRQLGTTIARSLSTQTAQNIKTNTKPRRLFKTISASVALTSVSLGYLLYQPGFTGSHVAAEAANISDFGASSPSTVVADLKNEESRIAISGRPTQELLLALGVYKLCTFQWLVEAAPHIIHFAESVHLLQPVLWFVKHTFFEQFCGGENPEECVETMDKLSKSGIHCILDLSVEADLHLDDSHVTLDDGLHQHKYWREEQRANVLLGMTKNCIRTAAQSGAKLSAAKPFAAVKVTAFAPPELLLRLNNAVVSLEKLFYDNQENGLISVSTLERALQQSLPPAQSQDQEAQRSAVLGQLKEKTQHLDYLTFRKLFSLEGPNRDIWWKTQDQKTEDDVLLTNSEMEAYDRMMDRVDQVCGLAHDLNVGIMIDAEQSYFQEAIDHVAIHFERKYNKFDAQGNHSVTVFNTYQMYTKASSKKLQMDVEYSKRENFAFAAKLVRGAYMVSERKRAIEFNYPSPIHDSHEDTNTCFNNGVRYLLGELHDFQEKSGKPLSASTAPIVFMVASHNRESVIMTVEEMERRNILPTAGVVHFGQLYGMQDQLSYTLGKNHYSIYKYLPYGTVEEVIPYLLRRAQENSSVLGSVGKERSLMWEEVKDRLAGSLRSPAKGSISASGTTAKSA